MLKSLVGRVHARLIPNRRSAILANLIRPLLPASGRVLDIGCGDGRVASQWEGLSVEGIDVLVPDDARIRVRPFDGRTVPYESKSFDAATLVDVLHHTDDPLSLLKEAIRVVRGVVVIKDHIAENLIDHLTLRAMDWVGNAPHGVALPYNYLSWRQWETLLSAAGLRRERTITSLNLYPRPVDWACGRGLHFIAQFAPYAGSSTGKPLATKAA